ncbi:hypothetical protein OS493_016066 [Desmophyllum pertusum]|uniref:TAZ-type domain-containing protein n=1 Tax=Desmophyllum pertusum TaxID=174260 RepID=A0A9X0A548_9CNID|nr:hypothetical protein OS493_016066 [Desmophyllum pertusum]
MTRESSLLRHNKIRFSFKMAPYEEGVSTRLTRLHLGTNIAPSFVHSSPSASPLAWGFVFESFELICAAFLYIITQTGSYVWRSLAAENDFSYSSQVHDGDTGNSSVSISGKSGVKGKPLIAIGDLAQFDSESKPSVECRARAHVPNVKNRFNLEDNLSFLGIQDIVSLVENYKSESLNIATAEKKKARGFFQDLKGGKILPDGGKQAAQVSKNQKGPRPNSGSSGTGSGGDDGDDDRKRNVTADKQAMMTMVMMMMMMMTMMMMRRSAVFLKGVLVYDSQGGNAEQTTSSMPCGSGELPTQDDGISGGTPPLDSTKKSTAQGLRVDVAGARRIARASFDLAEPSGDLQEAAAQFSLSDQLNCRHPEPDQLHHESETRLQQAFTCRRYLNSEAEWKECNDGSCREIQEYLNHSQNCQMRVLGGCKKCIWYKETLLCHASKCQLPLGACVVEKCDNIREYIKKKPSAREQEMEVPA